MASVSFTQIDSPKTIIYNPDVEKYSSTFRNVNLPKTVVFEQTLPFKVRFTSIRVPGVTGLVPPIGIAVIGVNNYIL